VSIARSLRRLSLALLWALPALAAAQGIQRVAPEHIAHYWLQTGTHLDVNLPYTGVNLSKPGCVAVSFVIGSNGQPLDVRAVRVVPPSDLGQAAVSMIQSMRFAPAPGNAVQQPIATYLMVPFNLPDLKAGMDATQRRQVMALREAHLRPCVLPGYGSN